jgi:hypothetical protein
MAKFTVDFMVRSKGSQKSRPVENYVAQSAMNSGLRHEDRRNTKIHHPDARRRRAMADDFTKKLSIEDEGGDLKVPRGLLLGIYQIGITSDVVLNQQARVAHGGGMADCLLGGPVAGKTMAV